jgi:hypothetical protein
LSIASPPKKNVNGSNSCHTKKIYYKQNNSFAHIFAHNSISLQIPTIQLPVLLARPTSQIAKKCPSIGKFL